MAEIGSNARPDLPLAVVVGAGAMGMAIARRLGQDHRLLIADRSEQQLADAHSMLRDEGQDVATIACDITKDADVTRLAAAASSSGPVPTLAHVAALSVAAGEFRSVLDVNIGGAARVAVAFADVLAPGGCAVFISSSSAHMGSPEAEVLTLLDAPLAKGFADALAALLPSDAVHAGSAYSLAKLAMNRMCRRLAPDWGRMGLRIVSLSPGLIATPMGAEAYKHAPAKKRLFDAVPLGREGTMPEMAGIVAFLASAQASYITGVDILADGGLMASLADPAQSST